MGSGICIAVHGTSLWLGEWIQGVHAVRGWQRKTPAMTTTPVHFGCSGNFFRTLAALFVAAMMLALPAVATAKVTARAGEITLPTYG